MQRPLAMITQYVLVHYPCPETIVHPHHWWCPLLRCVKTLMRHRVHTRSRHVLSDSSPPLSFNVYVPLYFWVWSNVKFSSSNIRRRNKIQVLDLYSMKKTDDDELCYQTNLVYARGKFPFLGSTTEHTFIQCLAYGSLAQALQAQGISQGFLSGGRPIRVLYVHEFLPSLAIVEREFTTHKNSLWVKQHFHHLCLRPVWEQRFTLLSRIIFLYTTTMTK